MNWLASRLASAVLAGASLLALSACEKDNSQLAVDLPSSTPANSQFVTVSLDVATVRQDSAESMKTDHFLVGRLTDNVAGTIEARSYLNLAISGDSLPSQFAATTPLTLDSVHLALNFDQVYGNSTTPGRFDLLALQSRLDDRTRYTAASSVPVQPQPLATNLVGRYDRKILVKTASITNTADTVRTLAADPTVHLVLKANAAAPNSPFVAGLLNVISAPGFNQARLDAYLPGIALVPSAGMNSIASFGQPVRSRLMFYFHYLNPGTKSHLVVTSLIMGPVSGSGGGVATDPRYFTQLRTIPPTGTPLAALTNAQAAVSAAALGGVSYLQSGTGLGTRIKFPASLLELLSKPGLAINRAELYVPIKPYSNTLFQYPTSIFAYEVNSSNQPLRRTVNLISTPRVVQTTGSSPIGAGNDALGIITNSTTTAPYYSLLITTYLQAYLANSLDGSRPDALVLMPNELSSSATRDRAALNLRRAALDANNLKLRVYYSQLR